ncbi:outer membrane lipoprotein LolB [Acinetobacter sp. ANC 4633]|uniref:lipoprotein insertase outer membrane protein LolB n=1 Tax=Acinetobacter sp. ANC 4633 TaxID=2529845 RepID=UPI00103C3AC2|nr:lipoprotein insertase outer membrane protein LolB [Acinetobacter sp. ANC 4633]TCB27972.1 outer membrane lipoprotein LolB [Acinetobacter sp. ANC 4633]
MHLFTKIGLGLLTSSSLILTGCQQYRKPQPMINQLPTTNTIASAQETNFSLQGKIGVRTPKQSGSAFFTWEQQQDNFDIELSGALGIGKTHIQGIPGQVTLNSAKTGLIHAATPEELLEKATGWQAPITDLVHWILAQPATASVQIEKDQQQRPTQFIEDGWIVHLSYNNAATLPNKLILKQQLDDGQENRITMVIQDR